MNWVRKHKTLKFTPYHMSSIIFEMWEALKLSSTSITKDASKNTTPPLYPHGQDMNNQS